MSRIPTAFPATLTDRNFTALKMNAMEGQKRFEIGREDGYLLAFNICFARPGCLKTNIQLQVDNVDHGYLCSASIETVVDLPRESYRLCCLLCMPGVCQHNQTHF